MIEILKTCFNYSKKNLIIEVEGLRLYENQFNDELQVVSTADIINKQFIKSSPKYKKIPIKGLSDLKGYIFDILISGNEIFISKGSEYKNCKRLEIYVAEIKDELKFNTLKLFSECASINIGAGRIDKFNFKGQEGILLTTNDSDNDVPGSKAQDDDSIFGKIIFINLNTKKFEIFSKGHRNAQGLSVNNDIVISTEHGPRGGDEINRIYYKKNYFSKR